MTSMITTVSRAENPCAGVLFSKPKVSGVFIIVVSGTVLSSLTAGIIRRVAFRVQRIFTGYFVVKNALKLNLRPRGTSVTICRMKRKNLISALSSSLTAALLLALPVSVYADSTGTPMPPTLAPVLISEVQPGSTASASEEFIELYNTTGTAIDLAAHGWQLELASTTATNWSSPLRTIALSGTIASGQSYIIASQFSNSGQPTQYLPTAQAWFSPALSAAAGHIRLTYNTNQLQSDGTCSASQTVVDEVEWSTPKNGTAATPSLDGRSVFMTAKSTGIPAGTSLQRMVDPILHTYVDTNSDSADFGPSNSPTPAGGNTLTAPTSSASLAQTPVFLPSDDCDPSPPVSTPGDGSGSTSPLEPPTGSPPTAEPGGEGDGSNTSGGTGGQSPAGPTIPATDQGLLAPQISELLPNPAAPQTDAADEFVELYNPNSARFDLSGFKLVAGTTTTHEYVFASGTLLAPGSFRAFFSADTGLSLSNSGSQVKLVDPLGNVIAQTDVYTVAKDGQTWVLANGVWQWTTSPTPNAPNKIATPIVTVSKNANIAQATAKPATKKSLATVKAAAKAKSTKSKVKTDAPTGQALVADTTTSKTPLHPSILAAVGVLAVLYGAYEYRHDMANYIRRRRDNRAARRSNRQAAAGQ